MFNIGATELIMILLVAFVFVGPKDLPKVARTLARLVKYLKTMFQEFQDETGLDEALKELKETEKDIKETLKQADPTKEIKEVKKDTEEAIKEIKRNVKRPIN